MNVLGLIISFAYISVVCGTFEPLEIGTETRWYFNDDDHFLELWSFVFDEGGQYNLSIQLLDSESLTRPNNTVQFLFCSEAQIDPLRSVTLDEVCGGTTPPFITFNRPCEWKTQLGNGHPRSAQLSYVSGITSTFRLLMLNCYTSSYVVDISYVAVNPGGEYLSLSEVPYKYLWQYIAIGWALMALAWMYNWWRYRFFNVNLQRILTLVPVMNMLYALISLYYWKYLSRVGQLPDSLVFARNLTLCFDNSMLFFAVLIMSKGWKITRPNFPPQERNRVAMWCLIVMLMQAMYMNYKGLFFLAIVVCYVLVLRLILACIQQNIAMLHVQHLLLQTVLVRPHLPLRQTPAQVKLNMFKRLQLYILVFLSVGTLFHVWALIFLRETPWVQDLLQQTIEALFCTMVGWYWGMTPFDPHFYRVVQGSRDDPSPQEQPLIARNNNTDNVDVELANIDVNGSRPTPIGGGDGGSRVRNRSVQSRMSERVLWEPGMPIPKIPRDSASWMRPTQRSDAPIYLIQLPGDDSAENIVVATPQWSSPEDGSVNVVGEIRDEVPGGSPNTTSSESDTPRRPNFLSYFLPASLAPNRQTGQYSRLDEQKRDST